jgi:hypothetical protein
MKRNKKPYLRLVTDEDFPQEQQQDLHVGLTHRSVCVRLLDRVDHELVVFTDSGTGEFIDAQMVEPTPSLREVLDVIDDYVADVPERWFGFKHALATFVVIASITLRIFEWYAFDSEYEYALYFCGVQDAIIQSVGCLFGL